MDKSTFLIIFSIFLFIFFLVEYSYKTLCIHIHSFNFKRVSLVCLIGDKRYDPIKLKGDKYLFHISRKEKKCLKMSYVADGHYFTKLLFLPVERKKILTIML